MTSIERVLVVAGQSDSEGPPVSAALDSLALRRAEVSIVSAFDAVPEEGLRLLPGLDRQIVEHEHQRLDALVAELGLPRPAQTKVLVGKPSIELTREIIRGRYDLLIKPAHAIGGSVEFGAVDLDLVRLCPCPVWLVKPRLQPANPFRVLAALGPRSAGSAHEELNEAILDFAAALAPAEASALHVVRASHVAPSRLLERVAKRRWLADKLLDEAAGDVEEQIRAHSVKAREPVVHVVPGPPAPAIAEVATRNEIDVVVLGTVARTGISGYFIGNTAERLLSRLACSVLALKPRRFATPVSLS